MTDLIIIAVLALGGLVLFRGALAPPQSLLAAQDWLTGNVSKLRAWGTHPYYRLLILFALWIVLRWIFVFGEKGWKLPVRWFLNLGQGGL